MRLVWTYSKDFKRGNKNNILPHDYIQYLYKKSLEFTPNTYHKIIYTDEENVDLFKPYVDEVIIREKKEFIFLADLKFDIAELLDGEVLITDGDMIFDKEMFIPGNTDIGFELQIEKVKDTVKGFKKILIDEGISQYVPCWKHNNSSSINLGLMYFNNDSLKVELINEYRKTQDFFMKYIEPKYKFIKNNIQFSACASQMLVKQFFIDKGRDPYLFKTDNFDKLVHLGGKGKDMLFEDYKIKKLI